MKSRQSAITVKRKGSGRRRLGVRSEGPHQALRRDGLAAVTTTPPGAHHGATAGIRNPPRLLFSAALREIQPRLDPRAGDVKV